MASERSRVRILICAMTLFGAFGCVTTDKLPAPGPGVFSAPPSDPAFPNWPMPPAEVERRMSLDAFEIPDPPKSTAQGIGGAQVLKIRFPEDGATLKVKWKRMPPDLDGVNNAPRKEIAAYELQKLVLDPSDYVVPTSVPRCVRLEVFEELGVAAQPTIPESRCVMGLLSVWIDHVTVPELLYDERRFLDDPVYARYLANFNLITYLIQHLDGRDGNFLVSKDESRRQVYAVDNGISFGAFFYNWFVPNWEVIRIPALRRESIDRLRTLRREDLDRLGVLVHMSVDEAGVLRPVADTENFDDDDGARIQDGSIQLGLTEDEIDDVWERIEDLIEDVDEGQVAVR
jgi:hypothetical protein